MDTRHTLRLLLLSVFGLIQTSIAVYPQTGLPIKKWAGELSKNYTDELFLEIRNRLDSLKDSARIFSALDQLEQAGNKKNRRFPIYMHILRAYEMDFLSKYSGISNREYYFRGTNDHLKTALYLSYALNDEKLAADICAFLGLTNIFHGYAEEGVIYSQAAAELMDKIGNEKFPGNGYITKKYLGQFLYYHKGYEKSIEYLREVIKAGIDTAEGVSQKVNMMNTIALNWLKLEKYDSALHTLSDAMAIAKEIKDSLWIGILSGSKAEVEISQGIYSEADLLLDFYYKYARQFREYANVANALQLHSAIDIHNKDYPAAIERLREALTYLRVYPQPFYRLQVYQRFSTAFGETGAYDSALHYYKLYTHLNDSLETSIAASETELAKLKADYERDIFRIQNLQKEKKQEVTLRNFIILGIIMVAAILILYLNRLRLINKHKEQIALTNKRVAEAEVESARKQLQYIAQNNLRQTDIIEKLQRQIRDKESDAEKQKLLDELTHQTILTEEDWDKFKTLFEKVYPAFFLKLKEQAMDITLAEQRMAALTRLQLPTRQMATMLGISVDSVHKSRQRLRQRLQVGADENLEKVISRF